MPYFTDSDLVCIYDELCFSCVKAEDCPMFIVAKIIGCEFRVDGCSSFDDGDMILAGDENESVEMD